MCIRDRVGGGNELIEGMVKQLLALDAEQGGDGAIGFGNQGAAGERQVADRGEFVKIDIAISRLLQSHLGLAQFVFGEYLRADIGTKEDQPFDTPICIENMGRIPGNDVPATATGQETGAVSAQFTACLLYTSRCV